MEKNKKYIEKNLNDSENQYWRYFDKMIEIEKELLKLTNEYNSLKNDVSRLDNERKFYQELYDELNANN